MSPNPNFGKSKVWYMYVINLFMFKGAQPISPAHGCVCSRIGTYLQTCNKSLRRARIQEKLH